jgi:hypothetical protein
VLDPFSGSGTTLLAAQSVGAESIGIDSHPFVTRVAQAKLAWNSDVESLTSRGASILAGHTPAVPPQPIPALLAKCYTPEALADLCGLRNAIAMEPKGDDISRLLWLAFVSIIRSTSFVGTAQWQYVLPNKRKRTTLAPLAAFGAQLDRMATDMRVRQAALPVPNSAFAVMADCRLPSVVAEGWATHVVCSPPYANNYDYADATRLEQTMLGEVSSWADLKVLRDGLIRSCSQAVAGYNPHAALADPLLAPIASELAKVYELLDAERLTHGGKKAYNLMAVAYFHDLALVWRSLRHACSEGATVCFVIGDSAPYGVHMPVERWLGKLALSAGFDSWYFEKIRDRNVKWKNRKHDVPLHEGRLLVRG